MRSRMVTTSKMLKGLAVGTIAIASAPYIKTGRYVQRGVFQWATPECIVIEPYQGSPNRYWADDHSEPFVTHGIASQELSAKVNILDRSGVTIVSVAGDKYLAPNFFTGRPRLMATDVNVVGRRRPLK